MLTKRRYCFDYVRRRDKRGGWGVVGEGTSGPRAPVLRSADKAHSYCALRDSSPLEPTTYNNILYKYYYNNIYYNPLCTVVLLYNVRIRMCNVLLCVTISVCPGRNIALFHIVISPIVSPMAIDALLDNIILRICYCLFYYYFDRVPDASPRGNQPRYNPL